MIAPGSPEWLQAISPSKVPVILGVSRFQSQFSLWHEMAGLIPYEPATGAKRDMYNAGHAFEAALAALWRFENPDWRLSRGEVQFDRDDMGFRTLATIDRRATIGNRTTSAATSRVVEFKTARDLTDWGDDFTDQAPADYLAQVQWQMHVTGYTQHPGHLMVMGPFFRWHTYQIPYDGELAEAIEQACRNWMRSITDGVAPDLDDSVTTYETVRQLHPDIEDRDVTVDQALAREFLAADRDLKALTTVHRGLKTRVLDAMGTARTAHTANGLKVADRRPGRHAISLYPASKTLTELEKTA